MTKKIQVVPKVHLYHVDNIQGDFALRILKHKIKHEGINLIDGPKTFQHIGMRIGVTNELILWFTKTLMTEIVEARFDDRSIFESPLLGKQRLKMRTISFLIIKYFVDKKELDLSGSSGYLHSFADVIMVKKTDHIAFAEFCENISKVDNVVCANLFQQASVMSPSM